MSEGEKKSLLAVLNLSGTLSTGTEEGQNQSSAESNEDLKQTAVNIGLFQGPLGKRLREFQKLSGIKGKKLFGNEVPLVPPDEIIEQARSVVSFQKTFQILGFCLSKPDHPQVEKELGGDPRLADLDAKVVTAKDLCERIRRLLKECEESCNNLAPTFKEWSELGSVVDEHETLIEFLVKISKKPPDCSWNEPIDIWLQIVGHSAQGRFSQAKGLLINLTKSNPRMLEVLKAKQAFDELYDENEDDCLFLLGLFRGAPNSKWSELFSAGKTLRKQMELWQYDKATPCLKELLTKVEYLKAKAIEHNESVSQEAEQAENKYEEIVDPDGSFDFSRFKKKKIENPEVDFDIVQFEKEQDEKFQKAFDEAVAAMKKASQKDQLMILKGLHAPTGQLTKERQLIQKIVYAAMKLDDAFLKADNDIRDKYREQLAKNSKLCAAAKNWKDVGPENKKEWVVHVATVQCATYKVPLPEIEWVICIPTEHGSYDQVTEILTLNQLFLDQLETMLNTVLHECTHRYQHILAQQFLERKLDPIKDAKIYAQAEIFACTFHPGAYIQPDDNHAAYRSQPCEAHAIAVGDEEGKALVAALTTK